MSMRESCWWRLWRHGIGRFDFNSNQQVGSRSITRRKPQGFTLTISFMAACPFFKVKGFPRLVDHHETNISPTFSTLLWRYLCAFSTKDNKKISWLLPGRSWGIKTKIVRFFLFVLENRTKGEGCQKVLELRGFPQRFYTACNYHFWGFVSRIPCLGT